MNNYIYIFIIIVLVIIFIYFMICRYLKDANVLYLMNLYNQFLEYFTYNTEFVNVKEYFSDGEQLDKNYELIREECINVMDNVDKIPAFHEVTKVGGSNKWRNNVEWDNDQRYISFSDNIRWETFFFKIYGNWITENCKLCPNTYKLMKNMKNIKTAFFSILPPGKKLNPHVGPFKGILRYHLGLIVPKEKDKCFILVNGKKKTWKEGESFMFDDTYLHEVKNNTNETRVILFLDIIRNELFYPIRLINNSVFNLIEKSEQVQIMKRNIE